MKKIAFSFYLVLCFLPVIGQGGWTWTELANLPMATSNNGVAAAQVGDTMYVYSFAGIDSTKLYSGIHTKAFRYNTTSNIWDTIPDLPDSLGGVIALSATTIQGKIYIIGGYHVYSNNSEISSYQVHVFDPLTNTYSRGTNLPVAIDDHVHFSYKDSLIYIISGWTSDLSPDQNTNAVQIYNPTTDSWIQGTPTPLTNSYMCFGASGALTGDTIYYAGGVDHSTFATRSNLRRGIIDPNDPSQISWSLDTTNPGDRLYRSSALSIKSRVFWIGGSGVAYNFDGLSYSSGTPVLPTNRILEWNPGKRKFYEHWATPYKIMDLRNIAKIAPNKFVLAGGMLENTTISNKTYLLTYDTSYIHPSDTLTGINLFSKNNPITIYPNPTYSYIEVSSNDFRSISIYSTQGERLIYTKSKKINLSELPSGTYFAVLQHYNSPNTSKLIIKN